MPLPQQTKLLFASALNRLRLTAAGRYHTGGQLNVFVEKKAEDQTESKDELSFSACEWIVFTVLMAAAIKASPNDPYAAYVDTHQLIEETKDVSVRLRELSPFSAVTKEGVHRNIHNIRKKLTKAAARETLFDAAISEREWAHLLLERDPRFGYRLNILPGNGHYLRVITACA